MSERGASEADPQPEAVAASAPHVGTEVSADVRGDVYVAISARRTAFDTLMWQVPALGLTAQAFLLTIALGAGSSRPARYIAASLALGTAVVAIQTMAKHRQNEKTDALILEQLERLFGVYVNGVPPHLPPGARGRAVGNDMHGWIKVRSFDLWVASLVCFALAAAAIIVIATVAPQLF